jgi:hypothetical protein
MLKVCGGAVVLPLLSKNMYDPVVKPVTIVEVFGVETEQCIWLVARFTMVRL